MSFIYAKFGIDPINFLNKVISCDNDLVLILAIPGMWLAGRRAPRFFSF